MDDSIGFFFGGAMLTIGLCLAVIIIASLWKIFTKAGQEGWKAVIPIYNAYILLKIVGKPGWWLLLFIIPIVNYVFIIWTYNMLSKSFGKDEGFTVGLVLLGIVFFPILGFGSAVYQGPYGDKAAYDAYRGGDITLDAERQ
ncbi:MAG TPA: DUF5684 domain-containing protein [Ferruginibacter sp.]|nr:DUF5684 domain-containing protein [Ferruginibacter sp.]HMP19909.1 DUF5684 domain-containing protein [Ferruginibacter sp.]